jgi:cyclic-di-AMP phosphodiesterase
MLDKFEKYKTRLIAIGVLELVVLLVFHVFIEKYLFVVQYLLILVNLLLIFVIFAGSLKLYKERVLRVSRVLGRESGEMFAFGRLGVLTYDEDGTISWMSELFDDYDLNHIGENINDVFPMVKPIMRDSKVSQLVHIGDVIFEVSQLSSKGVLAFQEKTEVGELKGKIESSSVVLGFAHLDNYEETTAYEEEQTIANIDMNIRQVFVDWATENAMLVRRLRPDRYLLLLNEEIYQRINKERFEIINTIRKEARDLDSNITLSLAFARKSDNYRELEEMANKALELAQSRGGDQAAINTKAEAMRYFGGSVETIEKRSKVRVRLVAQNLGELISQSTKVLILGHQMMDFDCMGSALGLDAITKVYGVDSYIILKEGDIESKLNETISEKREELMKHHQFITPEEALNLCDETALLVMVDHHNTQQSQVPKLIERANNIVVIDHHRRTGEFTFKPKINYIEASASSASELMVELLPYHKHNVGISALAATIMYTGVLVDTNRFRNRTGSRTFEAVSVLRKYGADLVKVEDMLRDEYEDFELKNKVLSGSEQFNQGYIIASYKEGELSRTLMSQVADEILEVRNVEASFVVSFVREDTIAISARSKGDLNVQRVMELMGGGGHFTGAATQIVGLTINEVVEMLKKSINQVKEEVE